MLQSLPIRFLAQEARALLTRLDRIRPFALQETSVLAASLSPAAQAAIEQFLITGKRELRRRVCAFAAWADALPPGFSPAGAQKRFTMLRLRFMDLLTQFDIFADVLAQRSEHDIGVWLGGLDVVSADALTLPRQYYTPPPIICYLKSGPGAAIRRARTRLPGGRENPVAIIQMPRERMVGSGIASSLVHEVGHQGCSLLDLVNSLRLEIKSHKPGNPVPWQLWERWISEILADFWSVAKLGIGATLGLMSVVSLPGAFVFRVNVEDPHPTPWLRVKLSCAMGEALYPHPQWTALAKLWESLYPLEECNPAVRELLATMARSMPAFIHVLLNHRPRSLNRERLGAVLSAEDRQPRRLSALWEQFRRFPEQLRNAPPTLAFAVIGQAKADGKTGPEEESRLLAELLTFWALKSTLDISALCAQVSLPRNAEKRLN